MSPLEKKIRDLIKKQGKIDVDEFFEISMFDPDHGYYIKNSPIGKNADFITAPEISQIYGEILACFVHYQFKNNNITNFQILELGGGNGTLLKDILTTLEKLGSKRVKSYILDVNEALITKQKKLLNGLDVAWIDSLKNIPRKPTLIIANEFFDALPAKQFLKKDGELFERIIKIDENDNFVFGLSKDIPDITTPENLKKDEIFENSDVVTDFMIQLCGLLNQNSGMAVIADYGYIKPLKKSSLQSIYKHKYNNIFDNIGDADLTFLVNFQQLYKIAKNNNLEEIFIQKQGEFLKSMGILERAKILIEKASTPQNARILESSIERLITPQQMGDVFKLMIIEKYHH